MDGRFFCTKTTAAKDRLQIDFQNSIPSLVTLNTFLLQCRVLDCPPDKLYPTADDGAKVDSFADNHGFSMI